MSNVIETLTSIDRGQWVRLGFDEDKSVELQVNQIKYRVDESLRLELSTDETGDYDRFQARSETKDGEWLPVEVRKYNSESDHGDWESLGNVITVTPLEEHRMLDSEIDSGHEG